MCGTQCNSPLGELTVRITSLNRTAGTAVEDVAKLSRRIGVCCRSVVYSTVAAKRLTAAMKSGDDYNSEDEFSVRQLHALQTVPPQSTAYTHRDVRL